jgi:GT2 family glycosyltransferase
MEAVTTEYFGWLDHDDCLNPRAIEIFSERLAAQPDVQIIYSDEDKINTKGEHFELYCKPDFSPELLLTQMYLCHFTAFRTELARSVGGFRPEMDGAQDFDLALRLLPQLKENRVVHVPLPLYHWRAWAESTALTIDAKPWAQQAGQRAQQAFLDANFGGGTAVPSRVPGLNEVHPNITTAERLNEQTPRVSVIIPTIGTKNTNSTSRFVDDAVASLRAKEAITPFEVIVVSTGEIDPVQGADAQVVYSPSDGNFNFAEAINLGRSHAHSEYLLLLNDDTTVVENNPITRMLELGQLDGVGIVGAKLTYPDGRLQHVGMVLLPSGPTHVQIAKAGKEPGYFGSTLTPRNFSAVTAAAMLVRTSVFDEVHGFDTQFARDFNDVDFCLRVRESGYRVAWTPYAHLTHHEGASIVRKASDPAEQRLFAQRWSAKYPVDPYYSPALNQDLQRAYEAL